MGLATYKAKRNFRITLEPSGSPKRQAKSSQLSFVIQKHQASRLHYDFRLEWNGVLLSWAVPKGPSPDPSIKRLAMQVEDHPVEYGGFEGTIPEGQYGGGTVMVWDHATWEPESEDIEAALAAGDLKFTLHGTKLKGSWVLVRTKGRPGKNASTAKPSWLLIKHRDKHANEDDIVITKPRAVVSRRLMAEIASAAGGNVEKAAEADPQ